MYTGVRGLLPLTASATSRERLGYIRAGSSDPRNVAALHASRITGTHTPSIEITC
jgi:hypothetical protein